MVKIRQRLWIFSLCAFLALQAMIAQTTFSQIQDTVNNSDGSPFNGTAVITWNGPTGSDTGTPLSTSARIYNGVLSVLLAPTTVVSATSFYQAVYYNTSGTITWTETWQVPASTTPLSLSTVRTSSTQNPPVSTGSGNSGTGMPSVGQYATLPVSISQVASLGADLATINSEIASLAQQISSVNASGGATPGTNAAFVDGEIPAGTLDGSNASFTTSQAPVAGSLAVYRNGLLQTAGVDYSIAAATITFLPGSIPHPNDVLTTYYRVPGTGPLANFADSEVPAGTVDGNNLTFTLVNAPLPALSLKLYKNGVLLNQGTDYTLNSSGISFANGNVTPQPGDSLVAAYRY